MIHVFTHWALEYTKQRQARQKKSNCDGLRVYTFMHFVCMHLGSGAFSAVDWRLDLSRQ